MCSDPHNPCSGSYGYCTNTGDCCTGLACFQTVCNPELRRLADKDQSPAENLLPIRAPASDGTADFLRGLLNSRGKQRRLIGPQPCCLQASHEHGPHDHRPHSHSPHTASSYAGSSLLLTNVMSGPLTIKNSIIFPVCAALAVWHANRRMQSRTR